MAPTTYARVKAAYNLFKGFLMSIFKTTTFSLILVCVFASSSAFSRQIYKCYTPSGNIVFTPVNEDGTLGNSSDGYAVSSQSETGFIAKGKLGEMTCTPSIKNAIVKTSKFPRSYENMIFLLNGSWHCSNGDTPWRFSSNGTLFIGPIIQNGITSEGFTGDVTPVNPEKGIYLWNNRVAGAIYGSGIYIKGGPASDDIRFTFKEASRNSLYFDSITLNGIQKKPSQIKCSKAD